MWDICLTDFTELEYLFKSLEVINSIWLAFFEVKPLLR